MDPEDLACEARSITDGDPLTHFTKFVMHGQGYEFGAQQPIEFVLTYFFVVDLGE